MSSELFNGFEKVKDSILDSKSESNNDTVDSKSNSKSNSKSDSKLESVLSKIDSILDRSKIPECVNVLSNITTLENKPIPKLQFKKLQFKKLHPDSILPSRSHPLDAGLDLHCVSDVNIPPMSRMIVDLGLSVAIPEGHYGRIAPRSGLAAKNGIDVFAGVLDQTYRGEIKAILFNSANSPFIALKGSRVAQLILERISILEPEFVDELDYTSRGANGFGSSGI